MKDGECVDLLQWALPRLRMRWSGFRKIRGRVCTRIARRVKVLQLDNLSDYREYLEKHPEEWRKLDELCRVTVSRFYRDKQVFAFLEQEVLPALATRAQSSGEDVLTAWSAGCACGEEPYTLALLWRLCLESRFPLLNLNILATDVDCALLARAQRACYTFSSVKNLPTVWRESAFRKIAETYCLKSDYKQRTGFQCNDIRHTTPEGSFHLILCRNLAFTYFDTALQTAIAERIVNRLKPGGALIIGIHETLPEGLSGLEAWSQRLGIYRKGRRPAGEWPG